MKQQEFQVSYEGGKWWTMQATEQPYEEETNFAELDKLADGFKWGMAVKGKGQRKRHIRSIVTSSIFAMLDYVRQELAEDTSAEVYLLTPDVEVLFVNA